MTKKEKKEMHGSTKIMTIVLATVLGLTVVAGLVMGIGTLGSSDDQGYQESSYSTSNSPF